MMRVKCYRHEAEAKANLKRVSEYHVVDPKPDDLTMSRLKQW